VPAGDLVWYLNCKGLLVTKMPQQVYNFNCISSGKLGESTHNGKSSSGYAGIPRLEHTKREISKVLAIRCKLWLYRAHFNFMPRYQVSLKKRRLAEPTLENARKSFNLYYTSLQNIIECLFGAIMRKFMIRRGSRILN